MQDYLDPAMREHIGEFVPARARELLRDREPPRADDALRALLSLVRPPGWNTRRTPSPIRRGALLFNIWEAGRRHGDRDGRDDPARGLLRRQSARAGDRLDHARAALRARPGLAARTGERDRHEAGQGVPGRVDAARLDASGPGSARLRAAAVPAAARIRDELHHRQVPDWTSCSRIAATSSAKQFTLRRFFTEFNAAGVIPGVDDPLAAHRQGREMKGSRHEHDVPARAAGARASRTAVALSLPARGARPLQLVPLSRGHRHRRARWRRAASTPIAPADSWSRS